MNDSIPAPQTARAASMPTHPAEGCVIRGPGACHVHDSWPTPAMMWSNHVEAPALGTDDRAFWDLCRSHDRHRRMARMQFHNTEELRTLRWGGQAVLEGLASARDRHQGVAVWFVGDLPMPPGCEGVHHAASLDEALAGDEPRVYL